MNRTAEPTRVCSRCLERKPWSSFRIYRDRCIPHCYCRLCEREMARERMAALRKADPDLARRKRRRHYHRAMSDPERAAEMLDRQRAKRGITPDQFRTPRRHRPRTEPRELVAARPFADALRDIMERDGVRSVDLGERLGVSDSAIRQYLRGERRQVEVATVERAAIADGRFSLADLYPSLYEASPA